MNTRTKIIVALTLAAGAAVSGVAIAQSMQHGRQGMPGGMHGDMQQHRSQMRAQMHGKDGMHHGGGHGQQAAKGDQSASTLAFNAVNEKMHRDMAIEFSGDADADFARAMIPHHQGAIDMAKIVIAFGKDAEIRKLAESVAKSQEAEIAFMREWLKRRGQ